MRLIKPGTRAWRDMALYVLGVMAMGAGIWGVFAELFPHWVLILHLRGGGEIALKVSELMTFTLGSGLILLDKKYRSKSEKYIKKRNQI